MILFIKKIRYIVVVFLLLGSGCNLVETEEVLRLKSPDSVVEAILMRTNAGATTSYVYNLYVVPFGKKLKKEERVFQADKVDGLEVVWKENNYLEIRYKKAQINNYRNFWFSKDAQNFMYIVEIRLIPLEGRSLQGYL